MNTRDIYRPNTNSTRLFMASTNLWPPFCIQMVIEGKGYIDIDRLAEAVESASSANPGTRLIGRRVYGRLRFIDSGKTPPIRIIKDSSWTGYNSENTSFLLHELDEINGPCCEVVVVEGDVNHYIFRAHHASLDARGVMVWVEDIFRVLRGETPLGSEFSTVEDDLLNLTRRVEKPVPGHYITPSGSPGNGDGVIWRRRQLQGKFSNLLSKVMCLVADEAWKHQDGNVRIGIPVDLRSRRPGLRSTSNLTNMIFFNVDKETTPEKLGNDIKSRLEKKIDGVLTWEDKILPFIPARIFEKILARECRLSKKSGLFRYSAFVSNLSLIDENLFSMDSYQTQSIFFIPQGNEWTPFFMTLQGNRHVLDVLLTLPAYYGNDGRIDVLLDRIISGIQQNP